MAISSKTVWILTELELDDGVCGWGEATLAGAEEAVLAELGHARELLVGRHVPGPGAAVAALRMAHASQARLVVMCALEQALLDALARRSGLTLAAFLGGPERLAVPVYANINRGIEDRSPGGFAARAAAVATQEAYRAIKIAPFDGLNHARSDPGAAKRLVALGIERIMAVREAVGGSVDLLVDCHSRLSPVMARTVVRETMDAGPFWLEEPLDEQAFDAATARALRGFANDRGLQIAGGEHLSTMTGARDFLARGGCDVILPDLRLTGVRTGMAMLHFAAASGVGASLHNPVGPVLDRISLQVAAAVPSFLILERQVRESPLFEVLGGNALPLAEGALPLPDAAGFGPPPDRVVVERCASEGFRRAATLAGVGGAGGDA